MIIDISIEHTRKFSAISRIEAKLTIPEKIGRLAGWDKCVSLSPTGRVVERDGGEWWSDGCRHCFCEQKQEYCSLISCAPRPADCAEENWVHEEGNFWFSLSWAILSPYCALIARTDLRRDCADLHVSHGTFVSFRGRTMSVPYNFSPLSPWLLASATLHF
ncbi:unnamed protein product [Cylicostephanus goldi]|uniref:VWFC domain-containing protein n=1 Tax=Cylicostephanus goldi TaxID=71465 RepID=A0A3P7N7P5_CYLGO|nr:unnamed protein product [Cylicostephanus goldi]